MCTKPKNFAHSHYRLETKARAAIRLPLDPIYAEQGRVNNMAERKERASERLTARNKEAMEGRLIIHYFTTWAKAAVWIVKSIMWVLLRAESLFKSTIS